MCPIECYAVNYQRTSPKASIHNGELRQSVQVSCCLIRDDRMSFLMAMISTNAISPPADSVSGPTSAPVMNGAMEM
jgi:hypothetical protein